MSEPMTPSTNPAHDEAVLPITPERLAEVRERFNAIPHADPDSLTGHVKGMLALIDSIAAAPAPASGVDAVKHEANEWADLASTGFQWLKNIRDGISTVDDAITNMEEGFKHCREVQALSPAATSGSEAGVRCTYCGDTKMIVDRVDGEITCPECGYAKPSSPAVVREPMETQGPYEAWFCKDTPADCCDYGVVSLSERREVCRVWREQDARAIAATLSPSTSAAEPVAWRWRAHNSLNWVSGPYQPANPNGHLVIQPLYATPPAPAAVESAQGVKEACDG
ncbi:TFIIB-type zinc ribbon-containing protein [Bosea sp. AS-1]|uniref:TFIIB-type zinc ribbon-containing protein n=1 Tax=Bosea sp. AS-1 TaxID=2015316 RepID=UPI0012FE0D8B|nr:TFIIB-type zinc ribbon-containing protein [Bosea sp. AS-1]